MPSGGDSPVRMEAMAESRAADEPEKASMPVNIISSFYSIGIGAVAKYDNFTN
jgi:hypothetical protein